MNQRPKGISIISVLSFIGGLIILAVLVWTPSNDLAGLDAVGFSSSLFLLAYGFLGIISFAAGIGMWTGKKWGWWLGAFYLAYAILRNANALFAIEGLIEQFGEPEDGVGSLYFKHGGRVITNSLVLFYFFRSHVTAYFNVDSIKNLKNRILITTDRNKVDEFSNIYLMILLVY